MTHALKGRKQTPEHIARRAEAWQKSTARAKASAHFTALNAARAGTTHSEETKTKMSAAHMGKQHALGTVRDDAFKRKLSDYWAANPTKHPRYIDGRGRERSEKRATHASSLDYRIWRNAVFSRDDWTCQHCKVRGGVLHADHIKPYATHPDLRLDVDNGRTLCPPCHRKTDTYGRSGAKNNATA